MLYRQFEHFPMVRFIVVHLHDLCVEAWIDQESIKGSNSIEFLNTESAIEFLFGIDPI